MKNINSQVLRKTFAVRFVLARFILARFTLVRFILARFVLAAILVPALLIGSAFTFGGSNLQAQAVQSNTKSGFFAGFVYLNGFKVDSSTKTTGVTNAITTITGTTRTSYEVGSAITTSIEADASSVFKNAQKAGIEALVAANCETGASSIVANDGTYDIHIPDQIVALGSFDVGTRAAVGATQTNLNDDGNVWTLNTCSDYFDSNALTDADFADYQVPDATTVQGSIISTTDTDTLTTTTNKSDKLSGIGLQFGWRGEKWRASLTHFTGKGGANELVNTVVMADYFFNEDFFVGGGLASMKLTNSTNGSTSASAISPAIQIGYKKKLTSNLSLNFGLKKYISGVSLKSSTTPTTTPYTPDPISNPTGTTTNPLPPIKQKPIEGREKSVMIGIQISDPDNVTLNSLFLNSNVDSRIEATQSGSRTVTIEETIETGTTTTTEGTIETTTESAAELKAPLVISISFHLSF